MSELTEFDALGYAYEDDTSGTAQGRHVPEQMLWSAVINVALEDARQGKRAAIDWLLYDTRDFVTVCSLAGISPVSVRRAAKRLGKPSATCQA